MDEIIFSMTCAIYWQLELKQRISKITKTTRMMKRDGDKEQMQRIHQNTEKPKEKMKKKIIIQQ